MQSVPSWAPFRPVDLAVFRYFSVLLLALAVALALRGGTTPGDLLAITHGEHAVVRVVRRQHSRRHVAWEENLRRWGGAADAGTAQPSHGGVAATAPAHRESHA